MMTEHGQIRYEHMHRYALCTDFVKGKRVLDIASGEGYGSAILSEYSDHVTGVDIDPVAVQYAKMKYCSGKSNLDFQLGRADAIPLNDSSVDVVVSFETIEHHTLHDEMMSEIKRVLRPGGLMIMSSPDKRTYSDIPQFKNSFHVKELYLDEFESLLMRYFSSVKLYGQRLFTSSMITEITAKNVALVSDRKSGSTESSSFTAWNEVEGQVRKVATSPFDPVYLVALCSDAPISEVIAPSVFVDPSADLWADHEKMAKWASELDREFHELQAERGRLISEKTSIERDLSDSRSAHEISMADLRKAESQLESLRLAFNHSQNLLFGIKKSFWWRLTAVPRFLVRWVRGGTTISDRQLISKWLNFK